jgi:hypothetical protein
MNERRMNDGTFFVTEEDEPGEGQFIPDPVITPDDQFAELFGDLANKLTLLDLLDLARQTWGDDYKQELHAIVVRLMVGVGDIARIARDAPDMRSYTPPASTGGDPGPEVVYRQRASAELAKELGNLIFSTIRWCDDLGYSPGECVRAAAVAQAKFAQSGRPR